MSKLIDINRFVRCLFCVYRFAEGSDVVNTPCIFMQDAHVHIGRLTGSDKDGASGGKKHDAE